MKKIFAISAAMVLSMAVSTSVARIQTVQNQIQRVQNRIPNLIQKVQNQNLKHLNCRKMNHQLIKKVLKLTIKL